MTKLTPANDDIRTVEHTRPTAHFTAESTWLNDPNGLLFHDGVWHLFFQNNPTGSSWANISWGHATSTDLVTWTHHPVAIPATEDEYVFSGSAVVDTRNSSGFGGPGVAPFVAVYTSAYRDGHPRAGRQAQSLAYSLDSGETWHKYAENPVLDIGSTEFRDPKVFWHGGDDGHWVMVVVEATDHRVAVYTSPNLRTWEKASTFGPAHAIGGVWECPDLFPLTVDGSTSSKWVLLVSLNPGGIAGGSGTQYFVGDFDGYTFTADKVRDGHDLSTADWLDYGRDYYAAVSFSGVPNGRRVTMAWASNWDYATHTPTSPWRSAMSLARELDLVPHPDGSLRVRQRPILTDAAASNLLRAELRLPTDAGQRHEVVVSSADDDDRVTIIVDAAAQMMSCDRTESGDVRFHPLFASRDRAPLPASACVDLEVIVDGCVLEIYAADGCVTLTQLVFPNSPFTAVTLVD